MGRRTLNPMHCIIAGSRTIKGYVAFELIDEAIKESGFNIKEIISGGAPGVDTVAAEYAHQEGYDSTIINANWQRLDKAAGYKRNQKMAWYAQQPAHYVAFIKEIPLEVALEKHPAGLIAIWNGKSKGTSHMIDIAREQGLEVFIKEVDTAKLVNNK